jgi:alkylation response protein AidB-like acyl-CoA dehydrogenase
MTILLNDEQRMLRESALQFLAERAPVAALRRLRDTHDPIGFDPALWREVVDLGWTAAVFAEQWGGLEVGWKGLGAVFEQIGRNLSVTPLLPTVVLGGGLLMELGSDAQRQQWLPRLIAGEILFALAIDETPRHHPDAIDCIARRDGDGWVLDGEKCFVLDGHVAQQLIVVARTAGSRTGAGGRDHDRERGLSLFLLDPGTPGVQVRRSAMVDSRNAARVRLTGSRVGAETLLGVEHEGFAALDRVLDRARVCLASEALGVIRESFERTVAYLKERVQFDVPIGSFQALQHRAARLYTEIEMLASCVAAALAALDAGSADAALLASLAKARASDLSEKVLNEAVQMHGGIGVTDEFDIGLYLKRARALQQTFGDGAFHRDRYARLKGF